MRNTQHLGFWLALVFVAFFASPLMRSGASMQQFVLYEVAQTRSVLGNRVGDAVVSFANGMFESTPLGMLANTAASAKHTKEEQALSKRVAGAGGEIMSNVYNSYLQGLILQSYVVAMRFAIVLVWMVLLLPMIFASVYDGFMQRSIKFMEFGKLRPATYTLTGMIVIPLLVLPLVYLVLPFSLSPLLAPFWTFIIAIPLSILISNMQPLFGR